MRKWMRERMKRRKKGGEPQPKQPANKPVPLQPDFYSEPSTAPDAPVVEFQPETVPEPEAAEPATVPESTAPRTDAQPMTRSSRRRRGRGRGGRSRSRSAAPQTPAVPEGEPPAPEPVTPLPEPAAHVTPARAASKGVVVLAIGLPGSGKSSWFKRHNIRPLSSDLLRELLFDDAEEQRFQDLVFSNLRSMLKARLIARRPMSYVDATNLTPHDRSSWIKLAKDYGYEVHGVFFDVPLEICMERHFRRSRVVAEDVMRKMAAKLKPPTFDEGFSKLTVVRVKQKTPE
jgi:predicted kinase